MNDPDNWECAVVRKLPHGLWQKLQGFLTYDSARARASVLQHETPENTGALDVWPRAKWDEMVKLHLTIDSLEHHSAIGESQQPTHPSDGPIKTDFAKAVTLVPDDKVLSAVRAAVNQVDTIAAWYGTLPTELYGSYLTSLLLGASHMLGDYNREQFAFIATAAWDRYHSAMANLQRLREVKEAKGNEG